MEITRIFDLLPDLKEKYNSSCLFAAKEKGSWVEYSIDRVIELSNQISRGLILKGIQKEDKIGIMSANRPEWNIVDFGIMQIGAIQVPFYPTLSEADFHFIVQDCDLKILFVSTQELYEKAHSMNIQGNHNLEIFTFDFIEGSHSWNEILDLGKNSSQVDLDPYRSKVVPEDLLTLIYTSGTTGIPKGVMLTHSNLVSQLFACQKLIPKGSTKALSFLPISHIFERNVIYLYMFDNIQIFYAESMDTIVANLNEVHPDIFTTVPRLLEKVYDRILAKGKELTGIKKAIFFWALNTGMEYKSMTDTRGWYNFKLGIARKLVFSKWLEGLGGNVRTIVSGGAPLQPRLARIFTAAGATVLEGYGLTETSPVISVNIVGEGHRIGTVGRVIEKDEVVIAPDGEILVKGPNIMKGYYKHPEKTAEVINADGFFHTGDLGEIDPDGFLKITGRKKEYFKTSGGKYVSPEKIENKLLESPFIEQIMVIGEGERFPAALIVPSFEHLKSYCALKNIPYESPSQIVNSPEILDKYQREIDEYNLGLGHWEQVKKFILLTKEWSIDGGEMTPKLSLKRRVVMDKFKKEISDIYKQEALVS